MEDTMFTLIKAIFQLLCTIISLVFSVGLELLWGVYLVAFLAILVMALVIISFIVVIEPLV